MHPWVLKWLCLWMPLPMTWAYVIGAALWIDEELCALLASPLTQDDENMFGRQRGSSTGQTRECLALLVASRHWQAHNHGVHPSLLDERTCQSRVPALGRKPTIALSSRLRQRAQFRNRLIQRGSELHVSHQVDSTKAVTKPKNKKDLSA
eukprot:6316215-Amphidinium_carterae.4